MNASISDLNVSSAVIPLSSLRVEFEREPKECKSRRQTDLHTRIVLPTSGCSVPSCVHCSRKLTQRGSERRKK